MQKSVAPKKDSIALDAETIRQRIGETRFQLLTLWTQDVVGAYDAAIAEHVTPDTVLLDAGCSRGDPDLHALTRTRLTVGCDIDMLGLRGNPVEPCRLQSTLDALPFANASFDVVVSKFVVEHLMDPSRTFSEFHRVLRPGGVVTLLTPNAYSFFTLVSRCIPERAKAFVKARLFGGHEEDTFRTHYEANTPGALTRSMHDAGFDTVRLDLIPGMWCFFSFSAPVALTDRRLEQIQARMPGLRRMSTQMLGVWRRR